MKNIYSSIGGSGGMCAIDIKNRKKQWTNPEEKIIYRTIISSTDTLKYSLKSV